jgi:predicted MFS family arabinose efflux permease
MTPVKELFHWYSPALFKEGSVLQKVAIFFVLLIVNLFIGLESFGVTISDDLFRGYYDLNQDQTGWINTMFLIGKCAATPSYIYLCQRFTVKKTFCIGLGSFIVGNLFSGLSVSYFFLLFLRFFTGASGGLAASSSEMILRQVVHSELHPHANALSTTLFGGGFAIAQIIGGVVGQSLHWRSVFFIDVVVVAIAFILIWGALQEKKIEHPSNLRVDYWSYLYYVLGFGMLVLFFTQVKAPWNTLGWRSDFSLINAAVVILLVGLFVRRCRKDRDPVFHVDLFKHPLMILMGLIALVMGFSIWSGTRVVSMLINDFQYEHITTGLILSMFGVAIFVAGGIVFLLRRASPFYFVMIGLIFVASSCFAHHAITLQSSPRDITMVLVLRGLGVGMCLYPIGEFLKLRVHPDLEQKCGVMVVTAKAIGAGLVSPIMSVIVVMRQAYHNLRFGEQMNIYSAAFKNYVRGFQLHAEVDVSQNWTEAKNRAVGYVIQNTTTQSNVLSLNDAFFLLGWLTIALIMGLCIYELVGYRKNKKAITSQ